MYIRRRRNGFKFTNYRYGRGWTRTFDGDCELCCTFIDAPRFVMEVISPLTEKYDRGEKKELYRQQEIDEYWIVDLKDKKVENDSFSKFKNYI